MKNKDLFNELTLWVRGRFSITNEEKGWILLILLIVFVGLIGRHAYLKKQTSHPLTPPQLQDLLQPGP